MSIISIIIAMVLTVVFFTGFGVVMKDDIDRKKAGSEYALDTVMYVIGLICVTPVWFFIGLCMFYSILKIGA